MNTNKSTSEKEQSTKEQEQKELEKLLLAIDVFKLNQIAIISDAFKGSEKEKEMVESFTKMVEESCEKIIKYVTSTKPAIVNKANSHVVDDSFTDN